MPNDTPLDILAKELGARAGRLERDNDLRVAAVVADFDRRVAQFELRIAAFEAKAAEPPGKTDDAGSALAVPLPNEIAENVALAIRMMAETPARQLPGEPHLINVYSNVTLPEAKAHQVNVLVPEQAVPVVNVAAPSVTVEVPKPGKEVTTVTGWDKAGRITSFEKQEVADSR